MGRGDRLPEVPRRQPAEGDHAAHDAAEQPHRIHIAEKQWQHVELRVRALDQDVLDDGQEHHELADEEPLQVLRKADLLLMMQPLKDGNTAWITYRVVAYRVNPDIG